MSKRVAVCVCAIVACMLGVAVSGCGSSASINPDDLIAATFSEGAPSTAGGAGYELDLVSSGTLRNRMLSAYRSMGAWKGDPQQLPAPDLFLTLSFTGDRQTTLACARSDQSFIVVEKYEHGDVVGTFYMRPNLMYEFMNDMNQARLR
jgi:hypothetical protein